MSSTVAQPRESPAETGRRSDRPTGQARARLEDQLEWYDRKAAAAQRAYKRVKLAQLVAAAAVPVAAVVHLPPAGIAALGALLLVLEGVQQLYQWQTNWVLYRATAEALKHERFLYLAHAGPYTNAGRHRILAERIEGLVSQEHRNGRRRATRWTRS